jgi:hypothetical protein
MNMKRTAKFLSNMKQSTIAGLVLIPLGAWVALSPFLVGSWDGEFHFSRFVLAVLPGAAAAVGGLVMLGGRRALVVWGGALAMAAGAWLMVGPAAYGVLGSNELGNGPGGESIRMLQWVGFFFGAGALVSLLSSFAVGFPRPLEFSKEEWAAIGQPAAEPATTGRARVPQPQERPRRQRRTKEPAKQGRARSKSSRRTKS